MQIGLQGLARHFLFHSTVSVSFREHGIPRWNSKRKLSNILGPFPGPEKATCLARKQWRPATGCRSSRSIRFKRSREIGCEIECNLDLASSVDEGCHQASFACHRPRQGALSQKEVGRVFEKKGTHTPSFDLPSRRVSVSLNRRPMLAHPSHRSKGTFLTLCIAVHQIGNPI